MAATITTLVLAAFSAALGVATLTVTGQQGPANFCFVTALVLGGIAWSLYQERPIPSRFPVRKTRS